MAVLQAPARASRPVVGLLLMCAACALFPIMNGFVKLLAANYDPAQIVWFRITVHLVLVAVVFVPRLGLGLFRTRRIGLQVASSVMMLSSTLCDVLRGARPLRLAGQRPDRWCGAHGWMAVSQDLT